MLPDGSMIKGPCRDCGKTDYPLYKRWPTLCKECQFNRTYAQSRDPKRRQSRAEAHKAAIEAGEYWTCWSCGETKPAADFVSQKALRTRLCKACNSVHVRATMAKVATARLEHYQALRESGAVFTCMLCKQTKPITSFHYIVTNRNAHSYVCNSCFNMARKVHAACKDGAMPDKDILS